MNRFFRTAYASTVAYLILALIAALITGVPVPFPAFSCLYFGLLVTLLPAATHKLSGKERLFVPLGALTALLGFVPLALWRCPLLHYLIHGVGMLFGVVFLSVLRHRTTHADFKAKFQFTTVVVLVAIGFVYLMLLVGVDKSGILPGQSENVRVAVNGAVPFAITMLVTGVLHLRGLRAQAGVVDERAFNRRQLRDTLIFAAIVTVVFLTDPVSYLKTAADFLLNDVLRPAAAFLARILAAVLKLISCARPEAEEPAPTPVPTNDPNTLPAAELAETEPEQYYYEGGDVSYTLSYIFLAIAALVLALILAVELRKLIKSLRKRNKNRGRGYPHETREKLSPKAKPRDADHPRKRSADPRERIRFLYAEFLRYLRKIPVRFHKSNTCGEIERRAKTGLHADPSDLGELTELYEKARYHQDEPPAEADAQRMKTLLNRVKNK